MKKFFLLIISIFSLALTSIATPTSIKAVCTPFQSADSCIGLGQNFGCFQGLPPLYVCCTTRAECGAVGSIIDFSTAVEEGQDYVTARCLLAPDDATGKWYDPGMCEFNDKVAGPATTEVYGERYTFAQVSWIINSLAIHFENTMWKTLTSQGSAQVASLMNPNVTAGMSGIQEVKNFFSKFDPASPVQAQGYGFNTLRGINSLWAASRNVTYLLMVVLLVIAGFMIMFRLKLGGQTVVTLQTMIPKIVITLIGITFSYAIAGFLIDLIYYAIAFVIFIMPDTFISDKQTAVTFFTGQNLLRIGIYFLIRAFSFTARLGVGFGGSGNLDAGSTILAILIILCLIILFLKIAWMLMKTYVMFIFQVTFAPWQILIGLIPGQSQGFVTWFKGVLSSVAVFFVTTLMFLIGMIFWSGPDVLSNNIIGVLALIGINPNDLQTGINDTRSLIGDLPNLPAFGSVLGPFFDLIFGFVVLALIPKAAEIVQKTLKSSGFSYGSAIGEAAAPATAALAAGWTGAQATAGAIPGLARKYLPGIGGYGSTRPTSPPPAAATPSSSPTAGRGSSSTAGSPPPPASAPLPSHRSSNPPNPNP